MNVVAEERGVDFVMFNGDCVEIMTDMPQSSVHLTVTSIPFASLFTYSASDRDFGNCRNHGEFFDHFGFWVSEILRVTKPGRLAAIHLMNLPTSKTRDGFIGLRDFRGRVIASMEEGGWIYHAETCIWKCPVVAVQRTKALGLLYKQLRKDSAMSRMGLPDYLCIFRKPGQNPEPVTHTHESFPVEKWQKWASPVWDDINQSRTLNARSAREHDDEAHLCPLQLDVIERALVLYSNAGDVIFDPFAGIGSTGVVALEMERRFVGAELKPSYYRQAVANLKAAEQKHGSQCELFAG
jgi:DNA modification methylase